jgi:hypothetical protein
MPLFDTKLTHTASATPAVVPAAGVTAPVITEDLPKPVEETKSVVAPVEEKKVEQKPKPTKRGSIFGNFVEKLKSPTSEKKEADLVPAPVKESEVSAQAPKLDELPKSEETPALAPIEPVAPVTDATTEPPKVEEATETKIATTPAKEKQHFSFGKFLGGNKERVKSPATEKTPEVSKTDEAPKLEETAPVAPISPIAPVEPVAAAETPVETKEEKKEEPVAESSATTTPAPKKRGSIFGALGGSVKKEKDGEEKPQGLMGLFRSASKAGKPKKEKEVAAPAKVDETAEPTENKTDAAPLAEENKATDGPAIPAEQTAIGDVVPDAVTVGQAHKSTPQVASTA